MGLISPLIEPIELFFGLEKLLDSLLKRTRIETEINVYSYINAVNNRLSCKQGIAETRSATLPTSRRWITASVPLDRNKIRAVIFTQNQIHNLGTFLVFMAYMINTRYTVIFMHNYS